MFRLLHEADEHEQRDGGGYEGGGDPPGHANGGSGDFAQAGAFDGFVDDGDEEREGDEEEVPVVPDGGGLDEGAGVGVGGAGGGAGGGNIVAGGGRGGTGGSGGLGERKWREESELAHAAPAGSSAWGPSRGGDWAKARAVASMRARRLRPPATEQ